MSSLETLSDYAWRIMGYLATTGDCSATVIALNGGTGETDREFIFMQLKACEEAGLTERWRQGIGSVWQWKLTRAGQTAMADRAAADRTEEARGYAEQVRWLHGRTVPGGDREDGSPQTLAEAKATLHGRQATLSDTPYNRGGTRATADYVARLERGAAPSWGSA